MFGDVGVVLVPEVMVSNKQVSAVQNRNFFIPSAFVGTFKDQVYF